jgi:phosphatidylinositol glycan class B
VRSASVSHKMSPSIFTFLTLAALPSVVYLSVFHGAAQHSSIAYLRSAIPSAAEGGGLGVLMPCHSTPWQSHLHRQDLGPNHAWFLTCPPPKTLGRSSSSSSSSSSSAQQRHTTEESEFYTDPARFLRMHFPPRPYPSSKSFRSLERFVPSIRRWPSHLVFFGTLLDGPKGEEVRALLEERGYAADLGWAASRTWNGWDWAQDDERRRGGVAVWRLRPRVADELE